MSLFDDNIFLERLCEKTDTDTLSLIPLMKSKSVTNRNLFFLPFQGLKYFHTISQMYI